MTDDTPARRLRRPAALLGAAALVAAAATAVTVGPAAQAADTPRTALGKNGQKLTVSASTGLDPQGETLRVTGSGYDVTKGVYVALCKDNGDNRIPTPCLGGADQTGGSGASRWIVPADSTDAPAGVAEKWGVGGTFDVRLDVKAEDGGLDCTQVTCSVVTRVDHKAPGDRSQDVRIPVAFEGRTPGGGENGGDGVDVPAGTVSYVQTAEFTTAGRPLDVLVHPDSGKLYVGSDNIPDTADIAEQGLYALDPATGRVLGHIAQAPGAGGTYAARVVRQIIAPLAGDGVAFHFPLRGLATAKDGDARAEGSWLNGATVTGTGPATASTVLVAQGAALSEIETATGTVKRTISLEGGAQLGVDTVNGVAWSVGSADGRKVLRRVDTRSAEFQVTATAELDAGSVHFVETDPATGNVWVTSGDDVVVYDRNGVRLKTLTAKDRPLAMAFDKTTGRAFVLREDYGTAAEGADGTGSLQILDSATFEQAAAPVALPGSIAGTIYAGVAVTPGATSVYLTKYAESKVVELDLRVSPKVTRTPTDQSVAAGDPVTFVAAADGVPAPALKWEVSPDGGQTWNTVAGATSPTYTFTARTAQDGYRYRVVFSNSAGTTRSSEFTLTVTAAGGVNGGATSGGGGESPGTDEPSGTRTVTGAAGQKLTVTPVNHLAVAKQTVQVTGSGYDEKKGIYVALCVDNGAGQLPTPCIGGVDMSGASHSSAWISSNPPDYGKELATPYGAGGTFSVELTVDAKDEYTDCFKVTCVLATRADHTLSGDRSQDVRVPVSFVGQAPVETDPEAGTTGGTGSSGSTTGTTGGTGSGGGDSGTTGSTGSTGTTGSSAGASSSGGSPGGTTTTGGSLASTGTTVGLLAGIAALLTTAGVYAMRRARMHH